MKCTHCGFERTQEFSFCPRCGTKHEAPAEPPSLDILAGNPDDVSIERPVKRIKKKQASGASLSVSGGKSAPDESAAAPGNAPATPPKMPLPTPPVMPEGAPPSLAASKPPSLKQKNKPEAAFFWLALANMNPFGLGYWLSGKKWRGLIFVLGGILLLAAGHLLNASKRPLLWGVLFLLLFIIMAVDLFYILRKEQIIKQANPGAATSPNKLKWLLPVLAVLVNLIFYGGFFLYRSLGVDLYEQGMAAFDQDDEYGAFGNWYALSQYYRLSLNRQVVDVQQPLGELGMLINTRNILEEDRYSDALNEVDTFKVRYPASRKKRSMDELGYEAYLSWAQDLTSQKEFEEGLVKLSMMEAAYPEQALAHAQQVEDAYMTHYLEWGDFLMGEEDYAGAVEKYEHLLSNYRYPDRQEYKDAYQGSAEANLQWGIQLNQEQEYEKAVKKFEYILLVYREATDTTEAVYNLVSEAYVGWAQQLAEQNEYMLAVTHLQTVIDQYENSPSATEAIRMLPAAYLGWGSELSSQQHYLLALSKFEALREMNPTSVVLEETEEAIAATILLLARDEGEDGALVMENTRKLACFGEIAEQPSVGILEDEPGRVLICSKPGAVWGLPDELEALHPGHLKYVVLRTSDTRQLGSCPYTEGRVMYRMQHVGVVTIRSVETGKVIAEKTFYGGYPGACPFVNYFYGMTDYMYGDSVSNSVINAWIAEVIK